MMMACPDRRIPLSLDPRAKLVVLKKAASSMVNSECMASTAFGSVRTLVQTKYAEMDDLPVIHLCLFGCGLVVNSAPTRQSGLVSHRVVDASVFPLLSSTHAQASVYAVAEMVGHSPFLLSQDMG
jgi:hypothetical protein